FTEMPTDNFVESSFWNFDALFQPQQHPARDQHDTFFLLGVREILGGRAPGTVLAGTAGLAGVEGEVIGFRWEGEEFERDQRERFRGSAGVPPALPCPVPPHEKFTPVKYFSIDRVFRNESLDATHLAEFHQVEGVVADRGLTLGHLMGTLRQFFTKLGISQLRFKPAYNPYTEPSMEVFSYHE
ncbi:SYFA ligase, partial [Campylorhamphus procurvoides]|nr:SYFA ligase [Campylorhamphus procurvoides]